MWSGKLNLKAWPEIKHMVSEELFSLPSSPRVFVNNEDAQLVDMEGEAGHVLFGVAEIQEIFDDAVGTDISDEDGGQRVVFGRFSGIIG